MEAAIDAHFKKNYQAHLQHLQLKGLRPKSIEAYSPLARSAASVRTLLTRLMTYPNRNWRTTSLNW